MSLRLYSPDQEEDLYIRRQAATWRRSELITDEQLRAISDACDPQLRQTNLFFRILFLLFSLLCVGAIAGLMAWLMERHGEMILALLLILCGAAALISAQYLVRKYRFYRHGIEEALAIGALLLGVIGILIFVDDYGLGSRMISVVTCVLISAIACFIYMRFGYLYMAVFGMAALCAIPFQFSMSHAAQRMILLGMLCCALGIWIYRDKIADHDFEKDRNAVILACLLGAVYLTVNLHIFGIIGQLSGEMRSGHFNPGSFPRSLYWMSYLLTFLLPVSVMVWGLKGRRRLMINMGLVMAVASLATNKSYLGLTRNSWDPAILGAGMVVVALILTRWLDGGPGGQRKGFTAREILKPEDAGVSLTDAAAALTSSTLATPLPERETPAETYLNGGASGGGGAERKF